MDLKSTCDKFIGEVEQIPPMYSAVKVNGQPLYKLARLGKVVERKPRQVTIHSIDILNNQNDKLVLKVACSKGTYIRTLVEDLGAELGCGAYVSELRRLSVGDFNQSDMVTMQQINNLKEMNQYQNIMDLILPIDSALQHYSAYNCSENEIVALFRGQVVHLNESLAIGLVRIYFNGMFFGIAEILEGKILRAKRLVNCRDSQVTAGF